MEILIQFIISFVIFFVVLWLGFEVTENREMPTWLNYKPFKCRKCLTFWTLTFVYLTIGLSFQLWWLLGTGLLLAILNSLAQAIDERENTVSIFEDDGTV